MVAAATLLEPVTCVPAWFASYLAVSNKTIGSGYRVDGAGNVPADPTNLAAAAGRALTNDVKLPPEIRARQRSVILSSIHTNSRAIKPRPQVFQTQMVPVE